MNSVPLRNDIYPWPRLWVTSHDSTSCFSPSEPRRRTASRRPFQSHYNKGTCFTGPSTAICHYISARQRAGGSFRIRWWRSQSGPSAALMEERADWQRDRLLELGLREMTSQRNIRHQLIKFMIILDFFVILEILTLNSLLKKQQRPNVTPFSKCQSFWWFLGNRS